MYNISIIWFFNFLIFFLGLFFGSFLKLVADRSLDNKSIIFPGSKCDFCNKKLKAHHMIPIVSFFMQKAKCPYCKKKLSFMYPIAELLTGLLFLSTALYFNIFNSFNILNITYFLYVLIIFCFYVVMTLTDLKEYIIPNKIVYLAILTSFIFLTSFYIFDIYNLFMQITSSDFGKYLVEAGYLKIKVISILQNYSLDLLSSFFISLFFIFLIIITKGKGMGGGDVKLAFLIGLFNTFPTNVLAIFLGFIFGSIISVVLILFRVRTLKDIIPFGPFLILGSIIALFFGSQIIDWYLALI